MMECVFVCVTHRKKTPCLLQIIFYLMFLSFCLLCIWFSSKSLHGTYLKKTAEVFVVRYQPCSPHCQHCHLLSLQTSLQSPGPHARQHRSHCQGWEILRITKVVISFCRSQCYHYSMLQAIRKVLYLLHVTFFQNTY